MHFEGIGGAKGKRKPFFFKNNNNNNRFHNHRRGQGRAETSTQPRADACKRTHPTQHHTQLHSCFEEIFTLQAFGLPGSPHHIPQLDNRTKISMSWGGGSTGSSPFLHQTCLQALTLAEGTGGGTDTIPPLQPAPTSKKEAAASPGVCGGRRGPVALPRFFCGPSSSSSPRVRCPFAGGAGWGWEPWQKALANGGMAERRSKKKMCWRNESALTSQPA